VFAARPVGLSPHRGWKWQSLRVKLAVAQFASQPDACANRERALRMLGSAAATGAELVVLPEAAMYPFNRPKDELAAAAEALDGPFVTSLGEAATSLGVTAIAGMFEKVPGDSRVYNTVVAVSQKGLLGRYRKLHLYDALGRKESDSLVAGAMDGDELLVLAHEDFTVGVVTCYDLRFPELFRALADKGVTLFAVPAAWVAGPLKVDHFVTMCRARAIENTAYLASAAQTPPEYCGHSLVVDPMGLQLAGLGDAEGVAVAEVSYERLRSVREALPVLTQRRYEVRPKP
jgi:predicted amidohydrolase